MKRLLLASALVLTGEIYAQTPAFPSVNNVQIPFDQQMNHVFQYMDLSGVSSHVLYDRSAHLADPQLYNGQTVNTTSKSDFSSWSRLYGTMFSGCWQSQYRLPDPQTAYLNQTQSITEASVIPFVLLHYNYESISNHAIADNLVYTSNGQIYDVPNRPNNPFVSKTCFAASPCLNTLNQAQASFVLQSNLYFSNTGKTIAQISVNMDDGLGYRSLSWGQNFQVNYTTGGEKEIRTKIAYTDGSQVENNARLIVNLPVNLASSRYTDNPQHLHFPGTRPYMGGTSSALVTIGYGCNNTRITKPLIYIEGFDPPIAGQQQVNGYGKLYYDQFLFNLSRSRQDLNNNTVILQNYLENEGYDLIYIDLQNSLDYIERNAYLVEEIITWVNQQKALSGSTEQNTVWCQSMGGLVGRYALRDMEMQGIDHQTERYVASDSPHQGANLPLGYQAMISNLANTEILGKNLVDFFPELGGGLAVLNSPAAKEMLIYHIASTSVTRDMPERQNLLNWFNVNGLPQKCQTVSIASGSETGEGHIFNPGDIMLHSTGSTLILPWAWWPHLIDLGALTEFTVRAVPNTNQGIINIFEGTITIYALDVPVYFVDYYTPVSNTLPLDCCPAGIFNFTTFAPTILNFLPSNTTFIPTFSFVPVMSSLDVIAPYNQNLYTPINTLGLIQNGRTPFDNYWSSFTYDAATNTTNENHTFFTSGNIGFYRDLFAPPHTLTTFSGYPNLNGVTYNYGRNVTQATTSHIPESYVVGAQSTIYINGSNPLGLPTDNFNPPTAGSLFVVSVGADCDGGDPTIDVSGTGAIIVGDNSTQNRGVLRIKSGATLIVRSGGLLRVNDNSKIVIEPGANLIYEDGAQIELLGDNAVLDIGGSLTLGTNANFTFTYPSSNSGYVRFSKPGYITYDINNPDYQIHHGTGARMSFTGTNRTDKVLEIAQGGLWVPDQMDGFEVNKGTVEYTSTNGFISVGCPNANFFSAYFLGVGNSQSNGIYLYGQASHNIMACKFENLQTGLHAFNFYYNAPLNVTSSEFTNCQSGLIVEDAGVNLLSCDFHNCGTGLITYGLSLNSSAVNSRFNYNGDEGAALHDGTVEFIFKECELNGNGMAGVRASGSTVNLRCSELTYNGFTGAYIDRDGVLLMNPDLGGGYNDMSNNGVFTACFYEARSVDANRGFNNLMQADYGTDCDAHGTNCPVAFYGTLLSNCDNNYVTTNQYNNKWKNGYGNLYVEWPPQSNQFVNDLPLLVNDLYEFPCNITMRVSDPQQQAPTSCPSGDGGGNNSQYSLLNNCPTCTDITTTNFQNTPIEDATTFALEQMDTTVVNGYSTAVNLLNEILSTPANSISDEEAYVRNTALRNIHQAFSYGIATDQIQYSSQTLSPQAQKVISIESAEKTAGIASGDYERQFYAAMREAMAWRAAGKRIDALNRFDDIMTWASESDIAYVSFWRCMTNTELQVLSGQIPKETFASAFEACTPPLPENNNARHGGTPAQSTASESGTPGTLNKVDVYPNPAQESFNVLLNQADETVSGIFTLYTADGRVLLTQTIYGGKMFSVNSSALAAGMYMYTVEVNGAITDRNMISIVH